MNKSDRANVAMLHPSTDLPQQAAPARRAINANAAPPASSGGEIGGKARNLAILQSHGLPVPLWRCIDAQHYRDFVAPFREQILGLLEAAPASPSGMEHLAKQIRALMSEAGPGQSLRPQLAGLDLERANIRYAVRSSCDVEDSSSLSFAGLFKTDLYVPADRLEERVRECWLSVFNPSCLSYLRKYNISPLDLGMGVVIQEMVESEKSGVLFQANPVGRLEEILVVAGYGVGEGIVSDQVTCDSYCYNRITKTTSSSIEEKDAYFEFDSDSGNGVKKSVLPPHLRKKPVLSEPELAALIALSSALAPIYSHPQDVEWAFDRSGRLFVLQSRPITTVPPGEVCLFDNSNITESYPGISSPLTVSLVKKVYFHLFYSAFYFAGCSARVLRPYESYFHSMVENVQGRIYYNLSSWHKVMSLLPFSSRVFIPALEEAIGAQRTQLAQQWSPGSLYPKARLLISAVTRFLRIRPMHKQYTKDFGHLYQGARKTVEHAKTNAELKQAFLDFFGKVFSIAQFGRVSDTYLMIFLQATRQFFMRLGLAEQAAQQLVNDLLVAEDDLASVAPIHSVRAMAQYVHRDEALRHALQAEATWDGLLVRLAQYPEFKQKLLRHLELYGDRTIAELKFETKTFRQKPLNLVRIVLLHAEQAQPESDAKSPEMRLRLQAEERLQALTAGRPLQRLIGRFLVRRLRLFVRLREDVRFNRARYFGLIREIFCRIADDWHAQGILLEKDDIFMLTDAEVMANIDRCDPASIRASVERHRAQWREYDSQSPEDRMWLKGDVARNLIPQVRAAGAASDDGPVSIQGIGCCSGIVEGEACVLLAPDETADVRAKILVANNTDPGWVFLIMGAQGLIVERGSVLSHTAIIGRELGIPTIVGAKNATSLLRDRTQVRMDGGTGVIRELDGHDEGTVMATEKVGA